MPQLSEPEISITAQNAAACPVCGSSGTELRYAACRDLLYPTPGEFSLRVCRACDAFFCYPQITPDQFDTYYPASYYPTAEQILHRQDARRLPNRVKFALLRQFWGAGHAEGLARAAVRHALSVFPGFMQTAPTFTGHGRLLEVGCSSGEKICFLRHYGWQPDGIEPSRDASAEARKLGINVQACSLEEANLPAGYYDVIELSHVFEHLSDPATCLAKLRDALAPGGRILLTLPNAGSLGFKLFGRAWRGLEVPRHCAVYSRRPLAKLCLGLGLKVSRVRGLIAPEVIVGSVKFALREKRPRAAAGAAEASLHRCGSGYHPEKRLKYLAGRAFRAALAAALLPGTVLGMAEVIQVEIVHSPQAAKPEVVSC